MDFSPRFGPSLLLPLSVLLLLLSQSLQLLLFCGEHVCIVLFSLVEVPGLELRQASTAIIRLRADRIAQ